MSETRRWLFGLVAGALAATFLLLVLHGCDSRLAVTCSNGVRVELDVGGGVSDTAVRDYVDDATENACR